MPVRETVRIEFDADTTRFQAAAQAVRAELAALEREINQTQSQLSQQQQALPQALQSHYQAQSTALSHQQDILQEIIRARDVEQEQILAQTDLLKEQTALGREELSLTRDRIQATQELSQALEEQAEQDLDVFRKRKEAHEEAERYGGFYIDQLARHAGIIDHQADLIKQQTDHYKEQEQVIDRIIKKVEAQPGPSTEQIKQLTQLTALEQQRPQAVPPPPPQDILADTQDRLRAEEAIEKAQQRRLEREALGRKQRADQERRRREEEEENNRRLNESKEEETERIERVSTLLQNARIRLRERAEEAEKERQIKRAAQIAAQEEEDAERVRERLRERRRLNDALQEGQARSEKTLRDLEQERHQQQVQNSTQLRQQEESRQEQAQEQFESYQETVAQKQEETIQREETLHQVEKEREVTQQQIVQSDQERTNHINDQIALSQQQLALTQEQLTTEQQINEERAARPSQDRFGRQEPPPGFFDTEGPPPEEIGHLQESLNIVNDIEQSTQRIHTETVRQTRARRRQAEEEKKTNEQIEAGTRALSERTEEIEKQQEEVQYLTHLFGQQSLQARDEERRRQQKTQTQALFSEQDLDILQGIGTPGEQLDLFPFPDFPVLQEQARRSRRSVQELHDTLSDLHTQLNRRLGRSWLLNLQQRLAPLTPHLQLFAQGLRTTTFALERSLYATTQLSASLLQVYIITGLIAGGLAVFETFVGLLGAAAVALGAFVSIRWLQDMRQLRQEIDLSTQATQHLLAATRGFGLSANQTQTALEALREGLRQGILDTESTQAAELQALALDLKEADLQGDNLLQTVLHLEEALSLLSEQDRRQRIAILFDDSEEVQRLLERGQLSNSLFNQAQALQVISPEQERSIDRIQERFAIFFETFYSRLRTFIANNSQAINVLIDQMQTFLLPIAETISVYLSNYVTQLQERLPSILQYITDNWGAVTETLDRIVLRLEQFASVFNYLDLSGPQVVDLFAFLVALNLLSAVLSPLVGLIRNIAFLFRGFRSIILALYRAARPLIASLAGLLRFIPGPHRLPLAAASGITAGAAIAYNLLSPSSADAAQITASQAQTTQAITQTGQETNELLTSIDQHLHQQASQQTSQESTLTRENEASLLSVAEKGVGAAATPYATRTLANFLARRLALGAATSVIPVAGWVTTLGLAASTIYEASILLSQVPQSPPNTAAHPAILALTEQDTTFATIAALPDTLASAVQDSTQAIHQANAAQTQTIYHHTQTAERFVDFLKASQASQQDVEKFLRQAQEQQSQIEQGQRDAFDIDIQNTIGVLQDQFGLSIENLLRLYQQYREDTVELIRKNWITEQEKQQRQQLNNALERILQQRLGIETFDDLANVVNEKLGITQEELLKNYQEALSLVERDKTLPRSLVKFFANIEGETGVNVQGIERLLTPDPIQSRRDLALEQLTRALTQLQQQRLGIQTYADFLGVILDELNLSEEALNQTIQTGLEQVAQGRQLDKATRARLTQVQDLTGLDVLGIERLRIAQREQFTQAFRSIQRQELGINTYDDLIIALQEHLQITGEELDANIQAGLDTIRQQQPLDEQVRAFFDQIASFFGLDPSAIYQLNQQQAQQAQALRDRFITNIDQIRIDRLDITDFERFLEVIGQDRETISRLLNQALSEGQNLSDQTISRLRRIEEQTGLSPQQIDNLRRASNQAAAEARLADQRARNQRLADLATHSLRDLNHTLADTLLGFTSFDQGLRSFTQTLSRQVLTHLINELLQPLYKSINTFGQQPAVASSGSSSGSLFQAVALAAAPAIINAGLNQTAAGKRAVPVIEIQQTIIGSAADGSTVQASARVGTIEGLREALGTAHGRELLRQAQEEEES